MESEALRWILLGIGIAGIAAIWLAASVRARNRAARDRDAEPSPHRGHFGRGDREPTLHGSTDLDADDEPLVIRSTGHRERPPERGIVVDEPALDGSEDGEMILVLYVVARPPAVFSGSQLAAALDDLDLRFGNMDIFHRKGSGGETVFSVVNMVNPGVFDPDAMETFTTPGVSLFTVLPEAGDGVSAFNAMLDAANGLADRLDGTVLDETRSAVTRQGCEHTREQIRDFELKLRRAHGRRG